jgi:segregation and condensation protein B
MEAPALKVLLESILFVADAPVPLATLSRITERSLEEIAQALEELAADSQPRGVRVQLAGAAVQLVTAPESTFYVQRYLGVGQDTRLSHGAVETLAIVAYKQPITRSHLEAIRGVNCDQVIATLRARGLVTEVGRAETPGRPYLYGTTFRFLEYFGLERPEDLPGRELFLAEEEAS